MNFLELTQKRCSIRKYLPTPIEEDKLTYILEAGRMAQSAVNYQPWYFLVVKEQEGREKVYECYPREWMKSAPMYIIVCGDHTKSWKRPKDGKDHLDIDGGIVIGQLCLAIEEMDLATCCICHFDAELLTSHFNLPEGVEPLAILPVAYPEDPEIFSKTPKKRKPLEELVIREAF